MGLGVVACGLSQIGEAGRLRVNRQHLRLPKWDADGFRVAVLSDLHVNNDADVDLVHRAFRAAIDSKPDLIAAPGDFYDEHVHDHIPMLEKALAVVKETKIPVVGTLGNHDYWAAPERVIRCVRESGIRLMRNDVWEVGGVQVYGIDDGLNGRDRHDSLGSSDARSVLALFHEPDFCTRVDKRVSLMLAGHSHGGQVCLPFGKALHMPRGARKYISGFYEDAAVPLFVTDGVGTTGPSVRTFCRPEVAILDLFSV